MLGGSAILWRLLPSVRRNERERFLFFFALSAALTLAQTVGFAGSEALFLANVGTASLPILFVVASLATVTGCLCYGTIVGRVRNDAFFVALLLGSGGLLLIASALTWLSLPFVFHALFCAAYLTQAVLINLHFWTFAADFFDTIQSKRLFPHLTVGASIGGMVGGGASAVVSQVGSAEALLLAWSAALLSTGLLIYGQRRNLARWRSLGLDEKDESSVAGIRSALQFLSRSSLARWLVASVVGMVTSLVLIQYLYMDVFVRAYPRAESLATFLGLYLALSNAAEIVVGNRFTPWLLRRFGVAQANLVHPTLTIGVFGLLALDPRLPSAILARANREMLENTLASTVRQLSYNALPFRFRGRMRALLEGVVQFGAMALAGACLLLLGHEVSIPWLCALGGSTGCLYLGASALVRREYLRSLVEEMRRGRLDLDDLELGIGRANLAELAPQWERLIHADRGHPGHTLLELITPLAQNGFDAAIARAFRHRDPRVRTQCIEALTQTSSSALATLLADALTDEVGSVRLAGIKAWASQATPDPVHASALRALLRDRDPAVRAEAAMVLGPDGLGTLQSLVESDEAYEVVEGLLRIPAELEALARRRLDDPDPRIRAAALTSLSRPDRSSPPTRETLIAALRDPEAVVREAAATALAARVDRDASDALVNALDDDSRAVRRAASKGLAALGETGAQAAALHLSSSRLWTMDAALLAVAEAEGTDPAVHLRPAYASFVDRAWLLRSGIELFPQPPSLESRFLHVALENAYTRSLKMALRVLCFLEDARVVSSVERCLALGTDRDRADALEVLSNLGDRHASDRLALLLEAGAFEDKLRTAAVPFEPHPSLVVLLGDARIEDDRWLRLAAAPYREHAIRRSDSPPSPITAPNRPSGEPLMERLLALRNVPIFAQLTLDRLEAIHQLMGEVQYLAGEVIVREGDPGSELYILLEGQVETYKHYGTPQQDHLSTLTPVGYFGEIAVLDNAPRSATNVASQDSRLLTLDGEPFKELVLKTPEISFEIFRVLTARIRAAETRQ